MQSKGHRAKDKSYSLRDVTDQVEQGSASCSLETHRSHETCLNIAQVPFRLGGEL